LIDELLTKVEDIKRWGTETVTASSSAKTTVLAEAFKADTVNTYYRIEYLPSGEGEWSSSIPVVVLWGLTQWSRKSFAYSSFCSSFPIR